MKKVLIVICSLLPLTAFAMLSKVLWCRNSVSTNLNNFEQGPEIILEKNENSPQFNVLSLKPSYASTDSVSYNVLSNQGLTYDSNKSEFQFLFANGALKISGAHASSVAGSLITFDKIEINIDGDLLFPKIMAKSHGQYIGGNCVLDTNLFGE